MNTNEWRMRQINLPGRVERTKFINTHYYKNGKLVATVNSNGNVSIPNMGVFSENDLIIDKKFLDSFSKVKEEIFDEEGFKAARIAAQNNRTAFLEEFKQALFEYHGISEHPKRELFFSILQSQTKDVGEMIGTAEEWVELLK